MPSKVLLFSVTLSLFSTIFTTSLMANEFNELDELKVISFQQICSNADATVTYENQLNKNVLWATFKEVSQAGEDLFTKKEVRNFVAVLGPSQELDSFSQNNCADVAGQLGIETKTVHTFRTVTFSSTPGNTFPEGLMGLDSNNNLKVKYLCRSERVAEINCFE